MPQEQLPCGVSSNVRVTVGKSGMRGVKPGETGMSVESLLWPGRRNLAAASGRLTGF